MAASAEFVLPPKSVFDDAKFADGHRYAVYNYYGRGPIARAKRGRFRRALKFGSPAFGEPVIDMGAADGVFIPTLCKYHSFCTAIEAHEQCSQFCAALIRNMELKNAGVVYNRGITFEQVRDRIGHDSALMYCLETVEHVGSQPDIWGTKVEFLHGCFTLLRPGGFIIISVPKMVGLSLLFKNALQWSLRIYRDRLSFRELLNAGIFGNTDSLESRWDGGHVGFNHLKLDKLLATHFTLAHREESSISVFYILKRR